MPKLALRVNGGTRELEADDPDIPLVYVLRELGLTGTRVGCGLAQCGACTVLVNGRTVRSCSAPASAFAGQEIMTIEGLGSPDRPDPLQAAFIAEQAAQCGYCTAGMVMSARALLATTPRPSEQEVRQALAGNLCRCGSHVRVIRAVLRAALEGRAAARRARGGHKMESPTESRPATISRRSFLAASGVLIVGLGLDGLGQAPAQTVPGADRFLGKPLAPDVVDSFLAVHADGSVTIFVGKVDIGTGNRIAMRQIVGEELDIPLERIAMVEGDTALTPNQGATAGSYGIARGGTQLRHAAATARQALLAQAAQRLGRPLGDLDVADGVVRARDGSASVGYGELIGDRAFNVKVDSKAPLKSPDRFRFIGQPLLRPDVPAKVTGHHRYLHDLVLPGMLHARVIRPPAHGATLVSADESTIASIGGARSYPILTFPEVPAIELELIQRLDQPPLGVGEAASTPVPAALANAVFDATGVRLRTVPFRADRVKAAL